jgi:hypothetical protein
MRYLLFVSILLCLLTACSSSKTIVLKGNVAPIPFWTLKLMDTVARNDFRLILSTPKFNITGIYIAKQINGKWTGAIMNEFGVIALNFVSAPNESKVMNVISFLDKWYIKKVMASDIQFIMEIDNPVYPAGILSNRTINLDTLTVRYKKAKELQRFPDGEIKYKNLKYALTYSLRKIYETER